jgi:hypothetical protein
MPAMRELPLRAGTTASHEIGAGETDRFRQPGLFPRSVPADLRVGMSWKTSWPRASAHDLAYFYQHAGHIIVLRGRARECVEVAHNPAHQFILSGCSPSL